MYTLPKLIKEIRNNAGLTQPQFAKILGVSTVLIAMIESGQKEVSKKLILQLAQKMGVHPSSITPFIFIDDGSDSKIEVALIRWGNKMQKLLIEKDSKRLKNYAK